MMDQDNPDHADVSQGDPRDWAFEAHWPFWEAIRQAEPEDHGPLLIYADWLEEQGDPARAEWIRVEVERVAVGPGTWRGRLLADRSRRLAKRLEPVGGVEEEGGEEPPGRGCEWNSSLAVGHILGLPRLVRTTAEVFRRRGSWFLRRLPIDHLELHPSITRRPEVALSGCESLRAIRWLRLRDRSSLEAALDSPHWSGLRTLDLRELGLTTGDLQLVLETILPRTVIRPRTLNLQGNRLGVGGIKALLACPNLQGLKRLNLRYARIRVGGLAQLAQSAGLSDLEELNLRHETIGDEGMDHLLSWGRLAGLRVLDLGYTRVGEVALANLLNALDRRLTRGEPVALEDLGLAGNPIGSDGLEALAFSQVGARLKRLNLKGVPLTTNDARLLAESPLAQGLERLVVGESLADSFTAVPLAEALGDRLELESEYEYSIGFRDDPW